MLMNEGRHPYTNETIIPEEVIDHVAYGRSVSHGKPEFPEYVSCIVCTVSAYNLIGL